VLLQVLLQVLLRVVRPQACEKPWLRLDLLVRR
jgi:hypothetical protein